MTQHGEQAVQVINHATVGVSLLAFFDKIPWQEVAAFCATVWWLSRFVVWLYKKYKKKKNERTKKI